MIRKTASDKETTAKDRRLITIAKEMMINFIHQAVDKYNETNTGK